MEINKVYNMDCLELMKQIPDNYIALTVSSPPYFNLKDYGKTFTEWASYDDYLNSNVEWFKQLFRITMPGGYVCWNIQEGIPNVTEQGRMDYPLMADIIKIATNAGFVLERQIIWSKKTSKQAYLGSYPYPITPIFKVTKECILVFRKLGQRKYTKEQKEKCKVDKRRWFDIMNDIWEIAPVSATKAGHPAPFPIEIPMRFIQVMTVNDDIVFDPFMGTFTTAIAAVKLQRNFIGSEISNEYFKKGQNKLEKEQSQITMFDLI